MNTHAQSSSTIKRVDVIERLTENLDRALAELAEAEPFAKSPHQTEVFQAAETLMASEAGLRVLYARADCFDQVGVFVGAAWANPSKLQPALVAGGLKAGGVYPVVETLSELRMLAIAKGRVTGSVGACEATQFLQEVMALNLEFLFPGDTEEERMSGGPHRASNVRLFALMAEELSLQSLLADVVSEIEQVCAQRPIIVGRVRHMIEMASRIPCAEASADVMRTLETYRQALEHPAPLCHRYPELPGYRRALMSCDVPTLETESRAFASSMMATGLASPHHAVLLRHLRAKEPELQPIAMG